MRFIKWLATAIVDANCDATLNAFDQRRDEARLKRMGITVPACNGPCDQGRRRCTTPEACSQTFFIPAEVH